MVHLPSQLRERAGGVAALRLDGARVADLIADLERRHPEASGWLTDERGAMRPHIKVFVNGEIAGLDDSVSAGDEVRILPAISGGEDTTELLVGTRKGLIVLRGQRGGSLDVAARAFEGLTVEYAIKAHGTYLASVTDSHFGPRVFLADDPTGEWEPSGGPAFPADVDAAVERIWTIEAAEEDGVLWAGVAPAALFRSEDGGRSWSLNRPLWNVPSRPQWEAGGGGLCLHSICPWPGAPERLAVGISAAGVWLTDDAGESWRRGIEGLVPRYLPVEAQSGAVDLCVHDIKRSPAEPDTMYLQFHGGVYRSDDAGASWIDIGSQSGLSSDFGFPLVVDPRAPDRAFVIPLAADMDRVTPEGTVRVFETSDRGRSWASASDGLPQQHSYLTILRQAFCRDDRDPFGLYFGATSGEVFSSATEGSTWATAATRLPPVLSVHSSS